ncbi:MAG TPA: nuclear transport factor 2 family protein [Bryobacterales bacterium]|nr:nuclear transport factor 2 family protein [Bryobacterales bacterium]
MTRKAARQRAPAARRNRSAAALVSANLAAVEAHFHNEAANEVEKACDLYTAGAVWEGPARGLLFRRKKDVVANYKKMFAAMQDVSFRNLQRFATADRVVDDSIVQFTLTGPGFLPLPAGSRVEMRLVHIFEMRSGKIAKEIACEMWKAV